MAMAEEKDKYKEIELRSEEVQEVMNHIPSWILRWGITVLFAIVIVLLAGSYLFKYPDVVEAEITVSTQNPPAYVIARISGRLNRLCVENGAVVRKDTLLGGDRELCENGRFVLAEGVYEAVGESRVCIGCGRAVV